MNPNLPDITLFFPISVDGRITSHDSDSLDPISWKTDPKIRASLHPLIEFTDPNIPSVTSGEAMAKIGVNNRQGTAKQENFQLIVIDDQTKLTKAGISYLTKTVQRLFVVCLADHPAIGQKLTKKNSLITHSISDQLEYLIFTHHLDLLKLAEALKTEYSFTQITLHSNARLNARWLSQGLISQLSVIISPVLVGKHGTPNLIDTDLKDVVLLRITDIKQFGPSFVNLRYEVVKREERS